MNKQSIHLLHHLLQIMIDRSNVKGEEAVPKGAFVQAGYSFPDQTSFPIDAKDDLSFVWWEGENTLHVTHGKQTVLVEVVSRLGGIEVEELRLEGVAEIFLGLHHTTDNTFEDINTVLFSFVYAAGEDHYSLVTIHQLHHTIHPLYHGPVDTTIPHCASSLQVAVVRKGTGVCLVLCGHCEGEPEDQSEEENMEEAWREVVAGGVGTLC